MTKKPFAASSQPDLLVSCPGHIVSTPVAVLAALTTASGVMSEAIGVWLCYRNHRDSLLVRKSAADIRAYAKSPKFKADAERLRRHTAPYRGEPSPKDLAEMPELTDDELASLVRVTHKRPVTLRLDSDVIEWLKEGGPKYQTRANAYLRTLMNRSRQLKAKSRG